MKRIVWRKMQCLVWALKSGLRLCQLIFTGRPHWMLGVEHQQICVSNMIMPCCWRPATARHCCTSMSVGPGCDAEPTAAAATLTLLQLLRMDPLCESYKGCVSAADRPAAATAMQHRLLQDAAGCGPAILDDARCDTNDQLRRWMSATGTWDLCCRL